MPDLYAIIIRGAASSAGWPRWDLPYDVDSVVVDPELPAGTTNDRGVVVADVPPAAEWVIDLGQVTDR